MSHADEPANDPVRCDALLVKFDWPEDGAASPARMLKALATLIGARLTLHQSMPMPAEAAPETDRLFFAEGYAYFTALDAAQGFAEAGVKARETVRQALRRAATLASIVRLHARVSALSATSTQFAQYHYVVETDVAPAAMLPGFTTWYDTEHVPGLASVPGVKRAARFTNLDPPTEATGPASHACYDLVSAATMNSAPWLAVLNTTWSARMRPHFCNTKRTLFKRVDG